MAHGRVGQDAPAGGTDACRPRQCVGRLVAYDPELVDLARLLLHPEERNVPGAHGTSVTVKIQVNRMVSWIWLGGVVLTLGTLLSVLPERRKVA